MITIYLNGEKQQIDSEIKLDQLLDLFSLPKQRVAVELNRNVVRRQEWSDTALNDQDHIEVVHFVGGG